MRKKVVYTGKRRSITFRVPSHITETTLNRNVPCVVPVSCDADTRFLDALKPVGIHVLDVDEAVPAYNAKFTVKPVEEKEESLVKEEPIVEEVKEPEVEQVEEPATEEVIEEEKGVPAYSESDIKKLQSKKQVELRAICDELGIEYKESDSKKSLVQLIVG